MYFKKNQYAAKQEIFLCSQSNGALHFLVRIKKFQYIED